MADISNSIYSAISLREMFEFPWDFTEVCPKRFENTSTLVLVMAWCWTGGQPLPEPMLTQCCCIFAHPAPMSLREWVFMKYLSIGMILVLYLNEAWIILNFTRHGCRNRLADNEATWKQINFHGCFKCSLQGNCPSARWNNPQGYG